MEDLIKAIQDKFPDIECTIFFTRKDGVLMLSPMIKHEGLTVPRFIELLKEYSRGVEHLANDMATKMALKDRKN